MFGNIYGLDLGTYEIKVFDKKQDKICRERDVIAIKNKKNIFAIGDKAYEMYEKAPDDIEVVFPMKSRARSPIITWKICVTGREKY